MDWTCFEMSRFVGGGRPCTGFVAAIVVAVIVVVGFGYVRMMMRYCSCLTEAAAVVAVAVVRRQVGMVH